MEVIDRLDGYESYAIELLSDRELNDILCEIQDITFGDANFTDEYDGDDNCEYGIQQSENYNETDLSYENYSR